jgi:signal transduction histidine kinase
MLLKRINASSVFMDKLLLDLLAFGRAGRTEVELGPVDMRKAWDAALFQIATQAEQANARLEVIGPLPAVQAHEATLGQCLANLLSNALKFVAPGVQPHIRFWAEELRATPARGSRIRLWVEDNGIGIPPEYQERAFRVFERLNGARYAGTGIGLSIVRKGVERMGGCVGLESGPGKGSRFWIELAKAD